MAYEDLLPHTVEVYRRSGETDDFGQPVDANPSQIDTSSPTATYPGRLVNKSGGLTMEERSLDVFVTRFTLFTGVVDIIESDAVRVLDIDGSEILPVAKIESKDLHHAFGTPHHLEISIVTQSGPS